MRNVACKLKLLNTWSQVGGVFRIHRCCGLAGESASLEVCFEGS